MSRHQALCYHGVSLMRRKERLSKALAKLDPSDHRAQRIQALIQQCEERLTSKSLRKDRPNGVIEDWEVRVVDDKIKVLVREHPELQADLLPSGR